MGMIKRLQSTQSSKFAISLQYLQKEVMDGAHFLHANECQSFYKLVLLFLMERARHVQSAQSTSIVMQDIQMFAVTCF